MLVHLFHETSRGRDFMSTYHCTVLRFYLESPFFYRRETFFDNHQRLNPFSLLFSIRNRSSFSRKEKIDRLCAFLLGDDSFSFHTRCCECKRKKRRRKTSINCRKQEREKKAFPVISRDNLAVAILFFADTMG